MQTTGGRGRLASFQTVRIILLSASFLKCSSWLLSSMVCLLQPLWLTVFLPPQLMFPFPPFELSCPFSETISSPATCRSWAQDHTLLSPLWHCLCMTAFITVSVCVSSVAQSCLTLCNPWTIAHQAPLSMGFSRKEYWGGLPFLLQGIFLTRGSNPHFLLLLHWQVDSLPRAPPEKPKMVYKWFLICAGIFLKA